MVRYADDFVILCESEAEAQSALEEVKQWVEENGLKLHPEKTRIVDMREPGGFDFLGYHFEQGMKWPRKKSMGKLKEKIREKTRRTEGRNMREICEDLNKTLRGWFEYFKQSKRNTFSGVDKYVRGRLRSILRKRNGLKGLGRGRDHQRWPNIYFTGQGLIALDQAFETASRSLRRG